MLGRLSKVFVMKMERKGTNVFLRKRGRELFREYRKEHLRYFGRRTPLNSIAFNSWKTGVSDA